MYATDYADLTDSVLDVVTARPGLTVAKIAKQLRADVGVVRRTLVFLAREHYVAQTRQGGREVYGPRS